MTKHKTNSSTTPEEEENTTTDLIEGQITPEEYAAYWGCDPCYDRYPRLSGDGYLFYNFQAQGNEPDFLTQFIPAIDRTIKAITDTNDQKGLQYLKTICQTRLNNPHLVEDDS
jgi:hypothetical protein